jgi:hypothetical protein
MCGLFTIPRALESYHVPRARVDTRQESQTIGVSHDIAPYVSNKILLIHRPPELMQV